MPIISAKVVKKPQSIRFCDGYQHRTQRKVLTPKEEPRMRLYGNAFTGDPPYALYLCLKCASESEDPKIIAALSAYKKENK